MYWYVQVHSCWSMYKYIEVYTSTYWYVHVCTMYLYIPGHTSMSYVGEVGTGSSMYWYVLVHTSMYWYVHVRTVYNGIYYHVYLCVHAMKAPLRHLERVASRTHYAPELLWLPFDTLWQPKVVKVPSTTCACRIWFNSAAVHRLHQEPGPALTLPLSGKPNASSRFSPIHSARMENQFHIQFSTCIVTCDMYQYIPVYTGIY